MEETQIVDQLKYLIRAKFRIKTVTPANCKFIAREISLLTKRTISETTIKRLFGFVGVTHNFSKYTLSVLAEFNAEIQEQLNTDCWKKVIMKTGGIADRTLLNIKSDSGIPYEHTISRKFAEQHFDSFLNSGRNFTCFISRPGGGKTILLSQLAKRFLSSPSERDNALLFLTVYDFLYGDFNTLSIADCIKNKLDINQALDLIEYIDHNCENSKLVIFIDGFNKLKIKSNIKMQLFERLHQFIEEIAGSRIQLVMGMRSADWTRFTQRTSYLALFKRKWFPGEYFDPENNSNVPTLAADEIGQILTNMNGFQTTVGAELKACLEVPLYLGAYYELRRNLRNPYGEEITPNQIIEHFVKFKVENSNYLTEKMYLIDKIIKLINYEKGKYGIDKYLLSPVILAFGNAYKELLSDGILVEKHNIHSKLENSISVYFARPYLYDYFLCSRFNS